MTFNIWKLKLNACVCVFLVLNSFHTIKGCKVFDGSNTEIDYDRAQSIDIADRVDNKQLFKYTVEDVIAVVASEEPTPKYITYDYDSTAQTVTVSVTDEFDNWEVNESFVGRITQYTNNYEPEFIMVDGETGYELTLPMPLGADYVLAGGCGMTIQVRDYDFKDTYYISSLEFETSGEMGIKASATMGSDKYFDVSLDVSPAETPGSVLTSSVSLTINPNITASTPLSPVFEEALYTLEVDTGFVAISSPLKLKFIEGYNKDDTTFDFVHGTGEDLSTYFTVDNYEDYIEVIQKIPFDGEILDANHGVLILQATRNGNTRRGKTVIHISLPGSVLTTTTSTTGTPCPTLPITTECPTLPTTTECPTLPTTTECPTLPTTTECPTPTPEECSTIITSTCEPCTTEAVTECPTPTPEECSTIITSTCEPSTTDAVTECPTPTPEECSTVISCTCEPSTTEAVTECPTPTPEDCSTVISCTCEPCSETTTTIEPTASPSIYFKEDAITIFVYKEITGAIGLLTAESIEEITYSILEETAKENFAVDPSTGELNITESVTSDTVITVVATTTSGESARAKVTVKVITLSLCEDNGTIDASWNYVLMTKSVNEDESAQSYATCGQGFACEIIDSFPSGVDKDYFTVEGQSIKAVTPIDYDNRTLFPSPEHTEIVLEIKATRISSYLTSPVALKPEKKNAFDFIGNIEPDKSSMAKDKDLGENTKLNYIIEPNTQFDIEQETGVVYPKPEVFRYEAATFTITVEGQRDDYDGLQVVILDEEHIFVIKAENKLLEDVDDILEKLEASTGYTIKSLSAALIIGEDSSKTSSDDNNKENYGILNKIGIFRHKNRSITRASTSYVHLVVYGLNNNKLVASDEIIKSLNGNDDVKAETWSRAEATGIGSDDSDGSDGAVIALAVVASLLAIGKTDIQIMITSIYDIPYEEAASTSQSADVVKPEHNAWTILKDFDDSVSDEYKNSINKDDVPKNQDNDYENLNMGDRRNSDTSFRNDNDSDTGSINGRKKSVVTFNQNVERIEIE
ncbi:hypothetical protein C0J52_03620 [Blattella germanica]|nr:hypothetical protein C0J52_03620 [Blattella germanica]